MIHVHSSGAGSEAQHNAHTVTIVRGDDHLWRSGNRKGGRGERKMKSRGKSWLVISDVKGKKERKDKREKEGRKEGKEEVS